MIAYFKHFHTFQIIHLELCYYFKYLNENWNNHNLFVILSLVCTQNNYNQGYGQSQQVNICIQFYQRMPSSVYVMLEGTVSDDRCSLCFGFKSFNYKKLESQARPVELSRGLLH